MEDKLLKKFLRHLSHYRMTPQERAMEIHDYNWQKKNFVPLQQRECSHG